MISKFNLVFIKASRILRIVLSKWRVKIKSVTIHESEKENLHFCPCCGHLLTKFIDWTENYRNIICPYCDSQPRHRALVLLLQQKDDLNFNQPIKLLHVAPEKSLRNLFDSNEKIDYITADLNDPSVDVKLDVTQIPYKDNTFDIIFCNHVLEHIINDRQAMKELLRVLKPNGWASLQVPIDHKREKTFEDSTIISPKDRLRYFGQEDHVRWYGSDYPERLKEVGFKVMVENIAQSLNSENVKKFGLRSKENLYFAVKLG